MERENIKETIRNIIKCNDVYLSDTGEWGFDRQKAIEELTDYFMDNIIKYQRKEKINEIENR